MNNDLTIIPVLNKIDMPAAQVDSVKQQVLDLLGGEEDEIISISAKAGLGIDDVLEAVVERIPPPSGRREAPLRALIFDSLYDQYRGVICFIRVVDGMVRKGQKVRFFSTGVTYDVEEVGTLVLDRVATPELQAGEVGYLTANIKELDEAGVGDTIMDAGEQEVDPLPGYQAAQGDGF